MKTKHWITFLTLGVLSSHYICYAAYPVTVVANTDPINKLNWVAQLTNTAGTLTNTANSVIALQAQLTQMGNALQAAGGIMAEADISAVTDQMSASVNFGAESWSANLKAGGSGASALLKVKMPVGSTDIVLTKSGVGAKVAGTNNDRNAELYSSVAARQVIISNAEAELVKSRKSRGELQKKLVEAREKLQESKDESEQRVLMANIQSLQTAHDMLVANEQSIIQSRDTALALIDNEDKMREIASNEDRSSKAKEMKATADIKLTDDSKATVSFHIKNMQKDKNNNNNWGETLVPAWGK